MKFLSGSVEDENIIFLTRELRSQGVEVHRIAIVRDEIDDIAEEVKRFF